MLGSEYSLKNLVIQRDGERPLSRLGLTFLKTFTGETVKTEAVSLFQCLTILSSGDISCLGVLRRGVLLGRVEWDGEKKKLRITSNSRVNILNANIRSTRTHRRSKE